ncbi:YigZ family protein [bacterium]|nr:YigZ family protein [bacterium]
MDVYYTLKKRACQEIKIKGSRFIGYTRSIDSRDEAEAFVSEISKKHNDATHICYAYRLGVGNDSIFQSRDGGEPSGTAGKPILNSINGRELTDVICVVVRYFGGIKLGIGGLARAYRECAGKVLDKGGTIERFITSTLRIIFHYDLTGSMMNLISRYQCQIEKTVYGEKTELLLQIRQSRADIFERDALNITNGQVKILREEMLDH